MRRLLTGITALLLGLAVLPAFADDKDKKDPAPDVKKDAPAPDVKPDAPAPDVKKDAPAPDVKKDAPAPDVKKDAAAPDVKKDAPDVKKDAPAPDAKKDAPDAKKDADKPAPEKTIPAGVVVGKLIEINETAKSFKVEVTYQVTKPNVGEMQAMANAENQLRQAMARHDANAAAQAQRDYYNHSQHTMTVENKTQQVDVASTEDLKVRLGAPPPQYDDKGNLKKLTQKDLNALKGDPKDPDYKLPGYPGTMGDLRQGAYVKVTLVKKKETRPAGPKPKDADPTILDDNLPMASMIEILAEPMPGK